MNVWYGFYNWFYCTLTLWKSSTRDLGCILAFVRNLDIQLDGHVLAFIGSVVTMGWLSMAPGLCATSWEGRWPLAPEKHWLLLSEMLCWRAKQLSVAEGATCGLRAAGTEWKMFDVTVNENTWQKPGEVKRFRSANKTGYCIQGQSKKKKKKADTNKLDTLVCACAKWMMVHRPSLCKTLSAYMW